MDLTTHVPGKLIGFAMMSQGFATAPGAIVVYDRGGFQPFVVHALNLQTMGLHGGHYHERLEDAYETFGNLLAREAAYLSGGAPVSEFSKAKDESTGMVSWADADDFALRITNTHDDLEG